MLEGNYCLREVAPERWDWLSSIEKARLREEEPVEIDSEETHGPMQDLLDVIHKPETRNEYSVERANGENQVVFEC